MYCLRLIIGTPLSLLTTTLNKIIRVRSLARLLRGEIVANNSLILSFEIFGFLRSIPLSREVLLLLALALITRKLVLIE